MGISFEWFPTSPAIREEDDDNVVLIFEEPLPNYDYFLGVDISDGVGLTNSVIHVLRRGKNGPDVQAAEWASKYVNPHNLPPIVNELGYFYKCTHLNLPACVCMETNNRGEVVQSNLANYFLYPHIYTAIDYDSRLQKYVSRMGFLNSSKRRKDIIFWGKKALEEGSWIVNSPWFIEEMASFSKTKAVALTSMDEEALIIKEMEEAGTARHARGRRDDRILAGCIAEWASSESRVTVDPSVMPKVVGEVVDPSAPKRDYRNTMITASDMKKELSKGFKRW